MPKRLKSCKNAGAGQTLKLDVFHWRASLHFLFYIVWWWHIKIKSMLYLIQGSTFKTSKRFFTNLCAGCCVCSVCTWLGQSWELTFTPYPSGTRRKTINRKNKEKTLNMVPVIVKICEHTVIEAKILFAKRQNCDSLKRFMCTYTILLE